MPLYQKFETDISFEYLQEVVKNLEEPVCILGGWAVYFTVNENFRKGQGRNYLGSKDIDIGFYLDKNLDENGLKSTAFGKSIALLECTGFKPLGFRYYKEINIETRKELMDEESAKIPSYNIFQIYVDPIVNNLHPSLQKIFGFVPIDEPLLSLVFEDKLNRKELKEFNKLLWLPQPDVLLATKIKSAVNRTKDEKLIKDVCDIYALSWYSEKTFDEIRSRLHRILSNVNPAIQKLLSKDILKQVETAIGIDADVIETVINGLKKK